MQLPNTKHHGRLFYSFGHYNILLEIIIFIYLVKLINTFILFLSIFIKIYYKRVVIWQYSYNINYLYLLSCKKKKNFLTWLQQIQMIFPKCGNFHCTNCIDLLRNLLQTTPKLQYHQEVYIMN